MNLDRLKTRIEIKKGGARLVAALLFLLCLTATSIVFTDVYLYPKDTLAASVPADTLFYLHYDAILGSDRASTYRVLGVPKGLSPAEVATFAIQDGDDVVWTTLLSWGGEDRITADERSILLQTVQGSDGTGTYWMGADPTLNSGTSLTETSEGRALSTLRSLGPLQAIFDPSTLLGDRSISAPSSRFGATLVVRDGEVRAHYADLGAFANSPRGIGYQAETTSKTAGESPLQPTLSLRQAEPQFNALPLLFPSLGSAAEAYGTPKSGALLTAERALQNVLSHTTMMEIFPDAAVGGNGFILHINENKADIAKAISEYLAAVFPSTFQFSLPDDDTVTEFIWNRDSLFTESDGLSLLELKPGVLPIALGTIADETILSSSPGLFQRYEDISMTVSDDPCSVPSGVATLSIHAPIAVFGSLGIPGNPIQKLNIQTLIVSKIGDNSGYFCGLVGANVDK